MSLEERINNDIKKAMLAKDAARLNALRAVKSAILLAKTEKGGNEALSAEAEIQLLQRLVKQRRESFEIYVKQNREDLAAEEKLQIDVISEYLPAQLSDEQLEEKLKEIIVQVGATRPQDMGKVMGIASKSLSGQAEGKRISEIVKKLLAS